VLAGYLIAAGRFDLAFVGAYVTGLGVRLIVASGRPTPTATSNRRSWQEFKRGVLEVGCDRVLLVTNGAQAAQFGLKRHAERLLRLYRRNVLGLIPTGLGVVALRRSRR
jgi:hypothetical protein